jgi:hypothetical protein
MSSTFSLGPSDSGHTPPAPVDRADLYAAETAYLDHMLGLASARMDRLQDSEHTEDDVDGNATSPCAEQLVAAYAAARGILESLRDDPQRAERTLEGLLGDSLREADRQLTQMGQMTQYGDGYSPTFWQIEQERNIRATILRYWWQWLRGDPVGM